MTADPCSFLTWEWLGCVFRANLFDENAELTTELFGLRAEGGQGVLRVLTQFCICMPGGNVKGEVQDDLVVLVWKQSLKYWNTALRTKSDVRSEGLV